MENVDEPYVCDSSSWASAGPGPPEFALQDELEVLTGALAKGPRIDEVKGLGLTLAKAELHADVRQQTGAAVVQSDVQIQRVGSTLQAAELSQRRER